jgi:enediyne biosynthesis protein E4
MKRLPVVLITLAVGLAALFLATRGWYSPDRGTPAAGKIQFTDVTLAAGIGFVHMDGRSGQKYPLEMLGSGAAFFDDDGDGDPDLYLVNGGLLPGYQGSGDHRSRLYQNRGDGTFTDGTDRAGVGDPGYGHGCAVGDYDNDGDLDLYVTVFGPNVLFQNRGDGTFTNVAREAGVDDPHWSSSCAFADYDLDGDLDLYVVNYLEIDLKDNPWCGLKDKEIRAYCEPNRFPGQPDTLYRNEGGGKFTDVTRAAGVYNPEGKGLGVVWGDYDNDGRPDIFVANDSTDNFLYHNRGDGTFEEVGLSAGVAVSEQGAAQNGMGTAFADWNDDGWLDLIVTNFADQSNSLHRNDRNGFFTDVTNESKTGQVSFPYMGWGVEFLDYDNDTYLDFIVANGHLQDNLEALGQKGTYRQRCLFFRNDRDGTFSEIARDLGPDMCAEGVGRGLALADIDRDGDVDILVTNSNGRPRLLRNDGGNRNHWLALRLFRAGAGDGIGARVTVRVGGRSLRRDVRSGSGFLSQSDFKVVVGLGGEKTADEVEIRWPTGRIQLLKKVAAGQTILLREGEDGRPDR